MHSLVTYDVVSDILRRRATTAGRRRAAFGAPLDVWRRLLSFEGCDVQFERALQRAGFMGEAPADLRRLLRDATGASLRQAIALPAQLAEIGDLAARHGIRVLALKGAARLLGGAVGGGRSLSDIDLLVSRPDAARLHRLMQAQRGYARFGTAQEHHLAPLRRADGLPVEIHVRLTEWDLPLDAAIWQGTRAVSAKGTLEIPSPVNHLIHTLEHATGLNWMSRYRLRDVVDVADAFTEEVSVPVVERYLRVSSRRSALETLLSAASELQPRIPVWRSGAWRTVRRVSNARLAISARASSPVTAERLFRYVGVLAEGSPRALARAAAAATRWGWERATSRLAKAGATILGALLVAGCSESSGPRPLVVPDFVFVSDADGTPAIFRFAEDGVERLSAAGHDDGDPHGANGRLVYTSRRDGNPEIYIADASFLTQVRLTSDAAADSRPALNPAGTTIAFVSMRSGVPRIWLMNADGANVRPLDTGSETFIPEGRPSWSPTGERIAFTSVRTNTSQVFVVPTGGGPATQLSQESSGAFAPAWTANGAAVLYVGLVRGSTIMRVPAHGGAATRFIEDERGVNQVACGPRACLATVGPLEGPQDIIVVARDGRSRRTVIEATANDHQPAIIVP